MPTIYSYGSNNITCTYTLSISRSGSTITVKAAGTIYGNGSSSDSNNDLYAHVCYNVSPANTSGTTTYVTSYGTKIGDGYKIVSAPLKSSSIPTSGKTFTATWTINNSAAVTYSNCALFLSKSASSASDVNGNSAYAFIGKKDSSLNVNNLRYYTQTLSIDAAYTNCGAPTTVTCSSSIIKPNDTLVISWSGATSGTSNKITGYKVYYKNGGQPSTSDYVKTVTTSATSGSCTIEGFSGPSQRGSTYYFKVMTIGTVSGYNSSLSNNYVTVKINNLPTMSSVTTSDNKVPSTGGSIKFTCSGDTNDSGQSISYYYSTSSSGTKTAISGSSITKTISAATTYYFWAYDGLEYSSSSISKSIAVNTKPTIGGAKTLTYTLKRRGDGAVGDTSTADDYDYNYSFGTATFTPSTTATVTEYKLLYSSSSSGSSASSVTFSSINGEVIGNYITYNKYYKVQVRIKDAYEYSDWTDLNSSAGWVKWIGEPNNDSDYNFALPRHNTESTTFPNTLIFGKRLYLFFPRDTGYTAKSVTITDNNNNTITGISSSIGNQSSAYPYCGYVSFTDLTSLTYTNVYKFKVTLANGTKNTVTKEYTLTYQGNPFASSSMSNIGNSISSNYHPFSQSGGMTLSINNSIFSAIGMEALTPRTNCKFYFISGDVNQEIGKNGWTTTTSGDTINIILTQSGNVKYMYDFTDSSQFSSYNGEKTAYLYMVVKNKFGTEFTSATNINAVKYNFDEPISNTSFTITQGNNESVSGYVIHEGSTLIFTNSFSLHNNYKIKQLIQIYRSLDPIDDILDLPDSSWVDYVEKTSQPISDSTTISSESESIEVSKLVDELNQSYYCYFRSVLTDVDNRFSNPVKIPFLSYLISRRCVIPTIDENNFNVTYNSDTNKLNAQIGYTNLGGGTIPATIGTDSFSDETIGTNSYSTLATNPAGIKIDVYYFDNNDWEKKGTINISSDYGNYITSSQQSIPTNELEWQNFGGTQRIKLVITTTNNLGQTKTYTTGEFIVYNLQPTVAYRPNQLGINTKTPDSDAILHITAASGKNKIIFDYDGNDKAVLIFNDGDFELEGFIINGGTWDQS